MGRPPIGDRAMSAAERKRRQRAKQEYRDKATVTKPAAPQVEAVAAGDAAAQAKIAALEQELAAAKQENAALKAEVAKLKAAATDAQQREPPPLPRTVAEMRAAAQAAKEAATAARKAKRAAGTRPAEPIEPVEAAEKIAALEQQLKAARTRIRNLTGEVRVMGHSLHQAEQGQYMPPELRKAIQSRLHPDQFTKLEERRRYEKLSQDFNQLFGSQRGRR